MILSACMHAGVVDTELRNSGFVQHYYCNLPLTSKNNPLGADPDQSWDGDDYRAERLRMFNVRECEFDYTDLDAIYEHCSSSENYVQTGLVQWLVSWGAHYQIFDGRQQGYGKTRGEGNCGANNDQSPRVAFLNNPDSVCTWEGLRSFHSRNNWGSNTNEDDDIWDPESALESAAYHTGRYCCYKDGQLPDLGKKEKGKKAKNAKGPKAPKAPKAPKKGKVAKLTKQAAAAKARLEVGAGVALVAMIGMVALIATKVVLRPSIAAEPLEDVLLAEPALVQATEATALQM